jgi:hypothetical protein
LVNTTIAYGFLLVGGIIIILVSSTFMSSLPNQSSAFATFPGENGKIAFVSARDLNDEIYVMNSDGGGQRNISNNVDFDPDWSRILSPSSEEDTISPVVTVPENMVVEATTANGGTQITFKVAAQDDVDGNATLEEDGSTVTQEDDVGRDITISCEPASGSEFPLGDTTVQCTATDVAGNKGTASFTVTIYPSPSPQPSADTTLPVITMPEDITEEATSPDGAEVSFEVAAEDDVDGPTDVSCDHNSGETFPIGETVVTCNAEDLEGNRAKEESFTITVEDTTAPDVELQKQ